MKTLTCGHDIITGIIGSPSIDYIVTTNKDNPHYCTSCINDRSCLCYNCFRIMNPGNIVVETTDYYKNSLCVFCYISQKRYEDVIVSTQSYTFTHYSVCPEFDDKSKMASGSTCGPATK